MTAIVTAGKDAPADSTAPKAKSPATKAPVRLASNGDGVDVRELLKAGAHFGHRANHWHPKMRPYIHSRKSGIYIIDLLQTAAQLEVVLDFCQNLAKAGEQLLFVSTKRHLRSTVQAAAVAAGMPYVAGRWFGGTLTNFATISKRIKHLLELEELLESGKAAETHSKREIGQIREEVSKLKVMFGGLKTLEKLPAAIFISDVITDRTALNEARKIKIPIIGITDTNADPTLVDYPIAANDDAVSAVKYISELIAHSLRPARTSKTVPVAKVAKSQNED